MTEHFDLTPRRLRHVLGHFASGLTVITAATDSGTAGFTCQSFSSLSLDPALVTFSPARSSSTWPQLRSAGRFTVNILPAEHRHLSSSPHNTRPHDPAVHEDRRRAPTGRARSTTTA
ncbi:hypothetical protein ARTHRO9AX_130096 [Arthrobacter sp. 9AX]|uniref:flavin reductase family protein n=1 Tax=Arthrobacter sp. 9AX TaxID=2653131 RepID=UPI0012EFABAC|nr:flavin reductase family protein [Arthrobacter sp. 9AX]VXB21524.1 hypothetical protein ARTHRO9AX_130096 [Arthrobacter sp. 9AX]